VLDVRRNQERAERHIAGSVHIPIHEVLHRLDEIPAGPVWVHCAGGYRAGVVAALLDAHGLDVVAVDDSFDNAGPAGLSLTSEAAVQGIPA
jgi:rhodanese-related sulfurtransferase